MTMLGPDEINRRLGFHPATEQTIPLFEANRAAVIAAAQVFEETLPPGREAAAAHTALQEALMWANAAVACAAPLQDPAGRQPNPLTHWVADEDALGPLMKRVDQARAAAGRPPLGPPAGPMNPPRPANYRPYA